MCEEGYYFIARIFNMCYSKCRRAKDFRKCVDNCVKDYLSK